MKAKATNINFSGTFDGNCNFTIIYHVAIPFAIHLCMYANIYDDAFEKYC